MKLVELLAKELIEWPEDAKHASQDYDKEIRFYDADEGQLSLLDFFVEYHADDACDAVTFAGGGVRVSKAQWQAERDRQKGGEWKRHRGGKCPVSPDTQVEVKHYDGEIMARYARQQDWSHDKPHSRGDIMQYRVISQPQAEEVEVKDTNIGTLSYKVQIDTTEATQAIDDLAAKWDQIDGPLLWRDRIVELEAHEEDIQREIASLHARLTEEGFSLVRQYPSVQQPVIIPYTDWLGGDIVRCVKTGDSVAALTIGKEYKLSFQYDCLGVIDDEEDHMTYCVECGELEFVRRP